MLVCAVTICGVTQIRFTVSGLCVDMRVFFVLVSLLYVGLVWFIIRLKYIPTRGYNITQLSAPDDGHMVARNMLSNY